MFTGIIQAIGRIEEITPKGDGLHLKIHARNLDLSDVQLGDSIAIEGACMTVVDLHAPYFAVDVSQESISKTVGLDQIGDVNLEKALRLNDRLGGHLVSGHVDGTGQVLAMHEMKASDKVDTDHPSWHLAIQVPQELSPFMAVKGSVVVNGVSLTINQVIGLSHSSTEIHINLIPHTLTHTTLQHLQPGHQVNLEVDLIARYLHRLLSARLPQ